MTIVNKARAHRATADRLLAEATEQSDNGNYTTAQTLLELSEAHLEAANRADLGGLVDDIAAHLEPPC